LKQYDKDNIPPKVIKVIRDKYTCKEEFEPKIIASVSAAAEGLCSWVKAMDIYDRVAKVSSLHIFSGHYSVLLNLFIVSIIRYLV